MYGCWVKLVLTKKNELADSLIDKYNNSILQRRSFNKRDTGNKGWVARVNATNIGEYK